MCARAVVGDTVMVYGCPAVVVELLLRERGQLHTARVTHDPPWRVYERRLQFEALRRRWPRLQHHLRVGFPGRGVPGGGAERPSAPAGHPGRDRHAAERSGSGRSRESRCPAGGGDRRREARHAVGVE